MDRRTRPRGPGDARDSRDEPALGTGRPRRRERRQFVGRDLSSRLRQPPRRRFDAHRRLRLEGRRRDRRGQGPRVHQPRHLHLQGHSVRRDHRGRWPLRSAVPSGSLGGRAQCHALRAHVSPGPACRVEARRRGVRLRVGRRPARRGLPAGQRVDAGARRCAAPRAGLDSRRPVPRRLGPGARSPTTAST